MTTISRPDPADALAPTVVLGIWLLGQGGMQIARHSKRGRPTTGYDAVAGCP
jgi:hypothetical protein